MWFTPVDFFLIPFSIVWGGFALFWEGAVLTGGMSEFVLTGIPFVATGLYFMFGRFVYKRWRKLRTAYGVTADRVMVAVRTSSLTEFPLKQPPVSLRRSRDGRHVSVTFGWAGRRRYGDTIMLVGRTEYTFGNTGMEFLNRGAEPVAFYDVANAEALLAAIQGARNTAPTATR